MFFNNPKLIRNKFKKGFFCFVIFFTTLLLCSLCVISNTKKENEIRIMQYKSNTPKNDCHICGDNSDQLLSQHWGEKNVGIINLNTFEFIKIDINRYDDLKNLINKKSGVYQISRKSFQSGESVSVRIDSDRGIAESEIKINESIKLSSENLESFLCSDCLIDLMSRYFYDENHLNIGLINFESKAIRPFEDCLAGFSSGDFYIWCDYKEDSTLRLIISYSPVRFQT